MCSSDLCAPKSAPAKEVLPAEEKSVTEVATDISDAGNVDKNLDTSGLNGVDKIFSDVENI